MIVTVSTMTRFAFVLLILAPGALSDLSCPENVVCTSTLHPKACPDGMYYREKIKSKNCCPGCIELKGLGQICRQDEDCAPGLLCESKEEAAKKRCSYDERQKCEYFKLRDETWTRTQYWDPNCLPDGNYDKKQCKGEKLSGLCYCSNENGMRIFGERPWVAAANMTCECSRLAENLRRTRKDMSLHCDENGNFEELQCDNGICWCANERTGIPYTPVVPEMMTRILPCFEEGNFGSQYLRLCDSVLVQTERAIKILKNHGLKTIVLSMVNCNYDGSYARFQIQGLKRYCSYRKKEKLTSAASIIQDCNCVYDQYVAKLNEKEFQFECDDNGSYRVEQSHGNMRFNVDSDGCIYNLEPII